MFTKLRRFLNRILLLKLQLSRFIFFLNNFNENILTYNIQNNNYFFYFQFRHTCAWFSSARWNNYLIFHFFKFIEMTSFVRLLISIKLIIEKLIIFMLILLLTSFSRVRFRIIFYIITLNNIIFLIFDIFFIIKSLFFIIKSLFFNIEISLIKNNIVL